MRIPDNKIEEIRSAANIVDIITEYVQLRKRGKNFIGLCPFHNEKTPSFTVSEEKQIYHCFGCHSGGNVYKFLMEYNKISFIEAVQELAEKVGINIEYDEEASQEKQSEQEILYDINTAAARYFSDNLLNSEEGEIARNYFQNRKIKPQIMRSFGLGYAFNEWQHFVNFCTDKKINIERALQLGLIGKSSEGRLYDKFSGRIIFPIFSPNGRVVAFAGRILENKSGAAKYLNSPESLIYSKGRILYGLSHAKDEIRRLDKAILVEGYMDLISLYQAGIKNVVAVSGTALTEEQVQLLSRYTKNVVLLFDADTAGIKASMRSIELLLKRDIEIKIVSLPEGEDPDSYVNNFGKEKFEDLIKQAQNFLEYQSAVYESQGMFEDASKTTEAIRELIKPVALINDELKRNLLIKSIAKKFNLREKLLEAELEKALKNTRKFSTESHRQVERNLEEIKTLNNKVEKKVNPVIINLEKEIIKMLYEGNTEIIQLIITHISLEDYYLDIHIKLADAVYEAFHNNEELIAGALLDKINDENLQNYIRELTMEKYSISKNWDEIHPGPSAEKVLKKFAVETIKEFKLHLINEKIGEISKNFYEKINFDEKEILRLQEALRQEKKNIEEDLKYDKLA